MSFSFVSLLAVTVLVNTFIQESNGDTCPYGACVYVQNNCSTTLWLQRTSLDGPEGKPTTVTTLNPNTNTVLDISGWQNLSGQRLYAWWINPLTNNVNGVTMRDKVEINICGTPKMCYNPTAVDYFGLPVHIGPKNSNDCPSVALTGSSVGLKTIPYNCATDYISTPPLGVCNAPYGTCMSNPSNSICHSLDSVINQCVSDGNCPSGVTTVEAYGCADWFSQQPMWCAAINRGMYATQAAGGNQNDPSQFYRNSPYNKYAAYIHTNLAQEYAFPYDDYQGDGASGYRDCETDYLQVVWCPGG